MLTWSFSSPRRHDGAGAGRARGRCFLSNDAAPKATAALHKNLDLSVSYSEATVILIQANAEAWSFRAVDRFSQCAAMRRRGVSFQSNEYLCFERVHNSHIGEFFITQTKNKQLDVGSARRGHFQWYHFAQQ
jgi:hypothetical protein